MRQNGWFEFCQEHSKKFWGINLLLIKSWKIWSIVIGSPHVPSLNLVLEELGGAASLWATLQGDRPSTKWFWGLVLQYKCVYVNLLIFELCKCREAPQVTCNNSVIPDCCSKILHFVFIWGSRILSFFDRIVQNCIWWGRMCFKYVTLPAGCILKWCLKKHATFCQNFRNSNWNFLGI